MDDAVIDNKTMQHFSDSHILCFQKSCLKSKAMDITDLPCIPILFSNYCNLIDLPLPSPLEAMPYCQIMGCFNTLIGPF